MKRRKEIDCKQIEKYIPIYLENKLSAVKTRQLLEHIRGCKACKEELTIQYMVSEGLNQAEENNDYDLVSGLENRNKEAMQQVTAHEFLTIAFVFVVFVILLITAITVFMIIF